MRILLVLLAACAARQAPRPTDGSIAGLVRDKTSGEPVGAAELRLSSGAATVSARDGHYSIEHIKPGRYSLVATYAGQPVTVNNIDVGAGAATFVDVTFTLGNPEPIVLEYTDRPLGEITRYHTKDQSALIEGTVTEMSTRDRVVGAVVTAVRGDDTLQTITDDQGRFRFDRVEPGTYSVSAYYSIGGRGQIEVRRSDIAVERAEGVIVPLSVELTKQ